MPDDSPRSKHVGPQDIPPAPATPEPESLTPRLPIDEDATFNKRPDISRLGDAIAEGRFPSEPHVTVLPHKPVADTLRDLGRYAIIARMLFRNHKNSEILAQLTEAGHPMGDSTLRRIMARAEFLDYYERYRNQVMEPLDKQIREDFKLAMPEAFVTLIKVMRTARNPKTQMEAAITILEGGDGLKKDRTERKYVFNVPPELQKAMFQAGKRFVEPPSLAPDDEEKEPS